jgi:sugar phosphate isomerase/epimerase
MNLPEAIDRLAVCSWSLQPTSSQDLLEKLNATGIRRVQLALDPLREKPVVWSGIARQLNDEGVDIISGMFGCIGEDYSTLESIRLTGGIMPDATWKQNFENIKATVALASDLGMKLVTFHAGFFRHGPADPDFQKMVSRLKVIAETFASANIEVALETGQETATELAELLVVLNQPNVGVNFDPANMLLYGKDNPVEALSLLRPWIRQVHIKDAKRTKHPGTWGEEVVVGQGEVDWSAFFVSLNQMNFGGHLVIEREAGSERVADICAAQEVIFITWPMAPDKTMIGALA